MVSLSLSFTRQDTDMILDTFRIHPTCPIFHDILYARTIEHLVLGAVGEEDDDAPHGEDRADVLGMMGHDVEGEAGAPAWRGEEDVLIRFVRRGLI